MVVAQHCKCAKCHWIVEFKMVNFMLCAFQKTGKNHFVLNHGKVAGDSGVERGWCVSHPFCCHCPGMKAPPGQVSTGSTRI